MEWGDGFGEETGGWPLLQGLSADHGSGAGCRRNRQTGRLRHAGAERDPAETGTEDVLRQLARLAFGRVDDAVTLALRRGETEPEGLELSAVSELRVTEKGVEVKLVDRVRALETLWKLLEASEPQQADPLLQALAALPEETGDWNEK